MAVGYKDVALIELGHANAALEDSESAGPRGAFCPLVSVQNVVVDVGRCHRCPVDNFA
jgi:hypothetical protein